MIIRDLPRYVEKAKTLIADLDTATPQVEIEARIVVTTRNFTRDLGIQWGFSAEQSTAYGNTTDLAFPNSIILNGNAVPSQLGIPADNTGPAGRVRRGDRAARPRLRGQPAGRPASTPAIGISHGQHPRQLQPRRGADRARAAGPRPAALDARR